MKQPAQFFQVISMNHNSASTGNTSSILSMMGGAFGAVVLVTGVANLILVHPIPAVGYLLLALVYSPPTNALLKERIGFSIPLWVKIPLGLVITMFTLGVSDLGDMIDKL